MRRAIVGRISEVTRYPRLDTVLMVEQFIQDHSGEYTIYQLWKNLPRKMMYQTYKLILSYLLSINKIAVDSDNVVGYIWNEQLGKRYKFKTGLRWD